MNQLVFTVPAIAVFIALSSCGGSSDSPSVGPCVVNYVGSALIVASAKSSLSGATVPTITLRAITIDGVGLQFTALSPAASNVRVVGNTLECTTPCGFSSQEGVYSFVVSGSGYIDAPVRVAGAYASREGSCPDTYSKGSSVNVILTPS